MVKGFNIIILTKFLHWCIQNLQMLTLLYFICQYFWVGNDIFYFNFIYMFFLHILILTLLIVWRKFGSGHGIFNPNFLLLPYWNSVFITCKLNILWILVCLSLVPSCYLTEIRYQSLHFHIHRVCQTRVNQLSSTLKTKNSMYLQYHDVIYDLKHINENVKSQM